MVGALTCPPVTSRSTFALLQTHNVALAKPIADFVVSLGSDGRILSQSAKTEDIKLDTKLAQELQNEEDRPDMGDEQRDDTLQPAGPVEKSGGQLIAEEEVEEGHVSWNASELFVLYSKLNDVQYKWGLVKMYLSGMGGRHPALFFFVFVAGLGICEVGIAAQTWFLGYWASQYNGRPAAEVPVL